MPWGGYLWVHIPDLEPGMWYFTIRAYNAAGVESDYSQTASKQVS